MYAYHPNFQKKKEKKQIIDFEGIQKSDIKFVILNEKDMIY